MASFVARQQEVDPTMANPELRLALQFVVDLAPMRAEGQPDIVNHTETYQSIVNTFYDLLEHRSEEVLRELMHWVFSTPRDFWRERLASAQYPHKYLASSISKLEKDFFRANKKKAPASPESMQTLTRRKRG